jgi:ATP-dependent DNA helicase RecQ
MQEITRQTDRKSVATVRKSDVDGPGTPGRTLEQELEQRFGLPGFHPWQREAVHELLDGSRKVLVVAPTGGGKSLCYQFPATQLQGTTVVVSPLVALMEDQVRGLEERGIRATWLSSTLSDEERRARNRDIRAGRYQLVYLAPERLALDGTVATLARLHPPLVAIDEAHCIAQWGHDFRPDYLGLRRVLEALQPPRVLACTATATPAVRQEILQQLGLDDASVILRGFARPNLGLAARDVPGAGARRTVALASIRRALGDPARSRGAAIIYAGTRRETEQTAEIVAGCGWRAAPYHAGLDGPVRSRVNRAFAAGRLDVVVATNAFGMGIDRPDIRAVVHVNAPGSIEAYYQEVGRAGRDGRPAQGLLLSSSTDFALRKRLLLHDAEGGPDDANFQRKWALFLDLMRYAEAGSCRHDYILRYFGDEREALGGCGHCDVCAQLAHLGRDPGGTLALERDSERVRLALAGVQRVGRRAGLVAVAEMLAGSGSKRMQQLRLDQLDTFGTLDAFPKDWVTVLLRRCLSAGLVDVTASNRPVPYLTAEGRSVLGGETESRVLIPAAPGRRARVVEAGGGEEPRARTRPWIPSECRRSRCRMARRRWRGARPRRYRGTPGPDRR